MTAMAYAQQLADELVLAYEEEGRLYSSMLALSEAQAEHIKSSGTARKVLSYIKRKAQLIQSITAIESKVEPMKAEWTGLPEDVRGSASHDLDRILDGLVNTIGQIAERESESRTLLEHRKDETGKAIAKLNVGARATKAYQPSVGQAAPRFTDNLR